MKTIILLITMACFASSYAQVANYNFVKEGGQPMEIIHYPGTVITNHTVTDDEVLPAKIPLGFPFMFNGVVYDSVGISENGFVWFGAEQADAIQSVTRPISTILNPRVRGIVCAVCDDLHPHVNTGLTTTIKSGVTGTSPMEELIIEWKNTSRFDALNDAAGEDTMFFQIKLYRFMNRIEVAYGHTGLNPNVTTQVEVGLKGALANDFNNRMTDAAHNWKNSLEGTDKASTCKLERDFQPEYGDMYVWMNLTQNPPNSVADNPENTAKVYPVPAGNELFVETENPAVETIEVYDVTGRMVKTSSVSGLVTRINVEDLQAGMYIVSLKSGSQVVSTNRIAISR